MRMTDGTYNAMNKLMALCFDANAIVDNLAYNLDYLYFNRIGDIVHHQVAHVMPVWADQISEKMLELSARPVRLDINGYTEEYKDLLAIFKVLHDTLIGLLEDTRQLISISDMNGDDEVRIFAEGFLEEVSLFVKQAEEWINAAQVLSAQEFNIHVHEYTHFIKE